jgi:hypothetical protein
MTRITPAARKAQTARLTSRTAFGIGVVVSLAANVTASAHTPLGIALGLWTPVAFLISMALLENVPVRGWIGQLRFTAILFLAGVAGWTSYWHMVEVCRLGGADEITAHLLPLTVDVMMALASAGLKSKAVAPAQRRKPVAKKQAEVRKLRAAA